MIEQRVVEVEEQSTQLRDFCSIDAGQRAHGRLLTQRTLWARHKTRGHGPWAESAIFA